MQMVDAFGERFLGDTCFLLHMYAMEGKNATEFIFEDGQSRDTFLLLSIAFPEQFSI